MKSRLIAISFLILFTCLVSKSNSQTLPFKSYSIQQGLSESVVHSLIQDDKGFIWVGTGFGLNRFDGLRFQQYYESHGLPDNRVNAIHQGGDGQLWLGTDSGAAVMHNDSIYTPDNLRALDGMTILDIFHDRNDEHWFSTQGNGVWRLDAAGELKNISDAHGYRGLQVRSVQQTPDGTVWIGTRGGLIRHKDREFKLITENDGLPEQRIRTLEVDYDGNLWIGTERGLILKSNDEFYHFHHDHGLNNLNIHSVTALDDGTFWLGTEAGASHFDGQNFRNYTTEEGLSAVLVYETMEDREGNIWLGTLGGGLNMFSGERFLNFNVDNGLTNNVVTGFEEDHNNHIWIATYGGGVLRYDGENLQHFGEQHGLSDSKLYSILEDSENRLWFGGRDGIHIFEDGSIQKLSEDLFPYGVVRRIVEDDYEDGVFWIATYNDGVFRFDGSKYRQFNTESGLLNNTVMDIKRDKEGTWWFATYGGVAAYDGDSFQHYTIGDGLPSNGVIHIHIDHEDRKWFSTFNGVAIMEDDEITAPAGDEQTGIITYFTTQDHSNQYWIGTNRGIFRFNPDKFFEADSRIERIKAFKLFNQKHGLIANELNAGASFVASDGTLWLGTVEGLSQFFPDRVQPNNTPPGIEFEEIMVSGMMVTDSDKNVFPHDQSFIQFNFIGLSFESSERILYEYKLEGLDDEWQTTRERVVQYPSLTPNQYRFRVRAYNADGVQSSHTLSYAFTIKPPFWLQWWFIALLILAVGGLILFYYRYFKATKQIDIERMRVQIASDLHDDVGSSLTELALQTDFLRAGNISDELRDTLKQLGDQSRKIVSSLDDIVWSIDARNDTAGDLTDRMQDYVNHIFRSGQPEVRYSFDKLNMDEKLPVHIKENIYLIFKEAVNNISKHSNATEVDIEFAMKGRDYQLLVKDNGSATNGLKKSGQGLRNIKLRARRINADLELSKNGGYTVKVEGKI